MDSRSNTCTTDESSSEASASPTPSESVNSQLPANLKTPTEVISCPANPAKNKPQFFRSCSFYATTTNSPFNNFSGELPSARVKILGKG